MPGLVLRGRYRLDVLIATGGMGEVWRGTDLAIDRRVAIKVVRPERAGDEEGLARFRAEAHHAGSLSHPNIAQVFDYGEAVDPEPGYLVMELVEGLSLTRILDDGPLPPEDVMDIVAQTARGLAAAHRAGLVHRDVKPGNLLVRSDGLVKITDFGIARAVGDTTFTQPGMLIGTPAYLAPERVSGAPASPATDLYSLGVVAYQCLTGHPPFAGEPLVVALAHLDQGMPVLPASVPPGVAALVAELTRQDPAARPPSAWDVALQAEHLRVLLSSPESPGRHGTAAAPLSVPGAEGALLAGAALPGTGPAAAASAAPPPDSPPPPPGWSPPPRGGPPRRRQARRGTSLPARGALAATGVAAIGFIAWSLATLPAPVREQLPDVAPPASTTSAPPSGLSRQSPVAATHSDGPNGGNAAVARAAATPQPSRSSSASPAPSSAPGTPSDSPSPDSPTPTPSSPTPSSPTPTPSTPTPSSPPPTTSAPTTPPPSTPVGTVTPSDAPSALVTVGPGFSLALGA